jgi:membrane associated rhomboid family serine protease
MTFKKVTAWLLSGVGILVFLNLFVHFFVAVESIQHEDALQADFQYIKESSNLKVMQSMHLATQDPILKNETIVKTEADPYLFTKDIQFWTKAQKMNFLGDQVQIENNKMLLQRLDKVFSSSTQKTYGISPQTGMPMNWITYQFTHATLFHLFSNVFFLILIASILQSFVSPQWIVGVYIVSGVTGALFYLLLSHELSLPLVGASGSVSGLMAFLCVIKAQENIKWSYFISPLRGGYGNIYLPAYLIFPMYLLTDFTQVLIDTHGVTNAVAHSAHVGGALCGFSLGLAFHANSYFSSKFLTQ